MATLHPLLTTAIRAARRAGSIITQASRDLDVIAVSKKRHNDFVTEVDKAAEAAIIDIIRKSYPEHAILAEESGRSGPEKSEYTWIIDPLDGTTNFIHGTPQYAVSIAVQYKDAITQACIFDPNRNELFTASKGRGAFMNDRRLRVSKVVNLADALVATGFPFRDGQNIDEYMRQFRIAIEMTAGIRRPGAATLDLAWVACGRVDAFWEMGLAPWDVAAGSLLVTEAGGLISDLAGESDWLHGGNVIGGTPKVFAALLQQLTKRPRPKSAT